MENGRALAPHEKTKALNHWILLLEGEEYCTKGTENMFNKAIGE